MIAWRELIVGGIIGFYIGGLFMMLILGLCRAAAQDDREFEKGEKD